MTRSQIEALKTLRERLNGLCGLAETGCPGLIMRSTLRVIFSSIPRKKTWTCGNCVESFGFVAGFDKRENCILHNPCPCYQPNVNHDEIFLLLDEYTGHGPLDGGDE